MSHGNKGTVNRGKYQAAKKAELGDQVAAQHIKTAASHAQYLSKREEHKKDKAELARLLDLLAAA